MNSTLPKLPSGLTFCTLPDGSRQCTGSQMGRRDWRPVDRLAVTKCRLVRVPLSSDGCDHAGAYWGNGAPLYRAIADDETELTTGEPGRPEMFLRAKSREQAKDTVIREWPNARFYA